MGLQWHKRSDGTQLGHTDERAPVLCPGQSRRHVAGRTFSKSRSRLRHLIPPSCPDWVPYLKRFVGTIVHAIQEAFDRNTIAVIGIGRGRSSGPIAREPRSTSSEIYPVGGHEMDVGAVRFPAVAATVIIVAQCYHSGVRQRGHPARAQRHDATQSVAIA